MVVRESFSLSDLNPISLIKSMRNKLFGFLIKVVISGLLIMIIMKQTGLMNEQTMMTYGTYLVVGSISMYMLTAVYLRYQCRGQKTISYEQIAKTALLAPAVIAVHLIALIVFGLISSAPEVGVLIYLLSWTSLGAMLVTGILYTTALEIAEKTSYC